jgi:hypothetical protein
LAIRIRKKILIAELAAGPKKKRKADNTEIEVLWWVQVRKVGEGKGVYNLWACAEKN